jgi:hypothetical protein
MPCTRNNPQQIPRRYNEKQRPIAKRQDKSKYAARESKKVSDSQQAALSGWLPMKLCVTTDKGTVVRPVQQDNVVNVK